MSTFTENTLVSDIAKQLPLSTDLFREFRIDFCCGGQVSLQEAVKKNELDIDKDLQKLADIKKKRAGREGSDPATYGNRRLVAYIQEKYHDELRQEIPNLRAFIDKVVLVHGERDTLLVRVKELFEALAKGLLDHTDNNVFPHILKYLQNPTAELKEAIAPHVLELETEHAAAGNILGGLREITADFTPNENACGTYQTVYARLEQLEKDTFNHVHLENNILFERVKKAL